MFKGLLQSQTKNKSIFSRGFSHSNEKKSREAYQLLVRSFSSRISHQNFFFNPENEIKLCPFYVRNLLKNSFIDGFRPEKFSKSALSQKHPLCRVSYSPTLKVLWNKRPNESLKHYVFFYFGSGKNGEATKYLKLNALSNITWKPLETLCCTMNLLL